MVKSFVYLFLAVLGSVLLRGDFLCLGLAGATLRCLLRQVGVLFAVASLVAEHWGWVVVVRGLGSTCPVESSWTRDRICVPCIGRQSLNHWTTRQVHQWTLSATTVPNSPFSCIKKKKIFFFSFSQDLVLHQGFYVQNWSSLVFPNKPIFLLSYCFILTWAYSAGEHTSYHKASPTQLASEHTSCLMCDVHLEFIGRVR